MKKILITGASGFIGKALHPVLSSLGHEVISIDSSHGDITDKNLLKKYESEDNEIPDVIADISKAKSELGWVPKTSFEDGIKKLINKMQETQ